MDPTVRRRVLLIEDNPMQRDLYAMVLEERFDVVSATRADAGYDAACSERPAVIVLDLLLPDEDGLRLSERLLANRTTSAIPIVVLTADDAAFARAKVAGSSFSAILTKPCPAERLMAAVVSAASQPAVDSH